MNKHDFPQSASIGSLKPGGVIAVSEGGYSHWAIVTDHQDAGLPILISLSKRARAVKEESWEKVVGKKPWRSKGYLGQLPPGEVLDKARSQLGKSGIYSVFNNNCQHFVHWAHGLPKMSPEVQQTLKWGAAGAMAGYAIGKGNWQSMLFMGVLSAGLSFVFRDEFHSSRTQS